MCVVCAVLVERRGILLVHAQCGYMLSRDSLVSGARRVLVHDGDVLKSGMVQRIEYNVCEISGHDTKKKVRATSNSARTKTVRGEYWRATQN
jgi:selenophosphate synthetase-related protein